MELLSRRVSDLERDVAAFDEGVATKPQVRAFLRRSSKRLNDVVEVLARLSREQELLEEVPEEFLLGVDGQVQTVRRLLALKRVSPDQLSILGRSGNSEVEEEAESLVGGEHSFDCHKQIDLETTVVREKRLRKIEDKFEYVNMICTDLAHLVDRQGQCIQAIDGKMQSGVQHTVKAKEELAKLHSHRESSGRKLFAVALLLVLVAIASVFVLRPSLKPLWSKVVESEVISNLGTQLPSNSSSNLTKPAPVKPAAVGKTQPVPGQQTPAPAKAILTRAAPAKVEASVKTGA